MKCIPSYRTEDTVDFINKSALPLVDSRAAVLLFGYFVLYMLVYLPVCVRQGLHWDEVFDVAGAANGTYVAAGRWGLALYRYLFGMGYMPWVSGVVAGLYIATALVIQTRLFSIKTRFELFMYGSMYMGCVQWVNQLQYSHQSDAVALSLLCVTVAMFLFSARGIKKCSFAVILLVYGCAVYQTAMLYFFVLLFTWILAEKNDGKELFQCGFRIMLWAFLSGCVYLFSRKIAIMLPVLTETDLNYMLGVQYGMSKWTEIIAAPSPAEKCSLLGMYAVCFAKVILKNALGMMYEGQWVYATTMIPLSCLLWRWLVRERSWLKSMFLVCIWLLPFALSLVVMTDQGPRVSLAEPLACASIWMLMLKNMCASGKIKIIFLLFALLVVLKGAYRVAAIAEDEKNLYASRIRNVSRLNARLLAIADASGNMASKFVYFGKVPGGAPDVYRKRWGQRYDKTILLRLPDGRFPGEMTVPLRTANRGEVQKFGVLVEKMPQWPAPGCVVSIDDTVLVKFAE